MRSRTNVIHFQRHAATQFALYSDVPSLGIRRLEVRIENDCRRESLVLHRCRWGRLGGGRRQRGQGYDRRPGIRQVLYTRLKRWVGRHIAEQVSENPVMEDSITHSKRCFAIVERIPSQSQSRLEIFGVVPIKLSSRSRPDGLEVNRGSIVWLLIQKIRAESLPQGTES